MENTNQTTIHVKAEFNKEFRRFEMKETTFSLLVDHLRATFKLDGPIKVLFLDDEKDLILIDSDADFAYAASLSGPLLRLTVEIASQENAEAKQDEADCWRKRGRGRGRGRGGKRGSGKWKNEGEITREQKLELKIAHMTSRVEILQSKLNTPDLPAEKVRALSWRHTNLLNKIENVKRKQAALQTPAVTHTEEIAGEETPKETQIETVEPETRHRGRGRGCRGGRGRGRGAPSGPDDCLKGFKSSPEGEQLWEAVQKCKQEFKEVRRAGESETTIESKWDELQKLKAAFREAKKEARNAH